jgi:hypothetical protein
VGYGLCEVVPGRASCVICSKKTSMSSFSGQAQYDTSVESESALVVIATSGQLCRCGSRTLYRFVSRAPENRAKRIPESPSPVKS